MIAAERRINSAYMSPGNRDTFSLNIHVNPRDTKMHPAMKRGLEHRRGQDEVAMR